MDKKTNVQLEENPKEQLAREIAKNMANQRREKALDEEKDFDENVSAKKSLSKEDFVKEPVSKSKIFFIGLVSFIVAFLIVFYIGGIVKFNGKFLPNTYINNGNFGGSSKSEAVQMFKIAQNRYVPEEITITKKDGKVAKISSEKIGYSDNIEKKINEIYKKQNHYLWFLNLINYTDYELSVEYSFDFDKIEDECRRKVIDTSLNDDSKNAIISKEGDSFVIVKETQGTKIAVEKEQELLDYVKSEIASGNMDIDISSLDCYISPEIVSSDLEKACAKLNKLKDAKFTFDFNYTKETLEGKNILDWIITDFASKDDPFDVDHDKAMEYVESLSKKYDTFGMDRTFNSTSRGTILVKQGKGNYGWWLDQEKTCTALMKAVKNIKSANISPIYYTSTSTQYKYVANPKWRTAKTDMGKTYIEIDLKKQHLWYYENGKKKYSCDIVSGKPTENQNTPAGVYKLWQKSKNKNVDGKTSKYWANISSGGPVLYCDPSQKKFGKDNYKKTGSNGSIKMPLKDIKYIYEKVPNGTPCIMYW